MRSDIPLSQATLSDAFLVNADLSNAFLSNAYLPDADLREADLSGANINNGWTPQEQVHVPNAATSVVSLQGADLTQADLSGADLSSADLSGAEQLLSGANLSGVDLSNADLKSAVLPPRGLPDVDLSGADLRGADTLFITPKELAQQAMLGSFAEFERSTIKQRTRDGLHRKYREGRYMGPIPFGYRAGDSEDGCLEIAPEEAELVRGIFERIAVGGTLYSEAARLNDLGVRAPSWRYASEKRSPAKHWSAPTIRTIVRNTTYSGTHKITLSTGEVVEHAVPTIVEPELQRQALARLEENRRFSGGRKTRQYLLSGRITCAVCGCSCVGRTNSARGKKYPYYRCSDDHALRLNRAPRGHAPYVRAEWLEETVWADPEYGRHSPVHGTLLSWVVQALPSGNTNSLSDSRFISEE